MDGLRGEAASIEDQQAFNEATTKDNLVEIAQNLNEKR